MIRLAALWAATLVMASGCGHRRPAPRALVPARHYVLGDAYQAGGFWFYPTEDYGLDITGIAAVQGGQPGLTADGELRDAGALTAAMQTIQLPAIVDVTNMENGRQVAVRVNDRGPASPGRIIAVSPRAAALLAMSADGAARVRVQIDGVLSRRLVEQLGGGPKLRIETAPRAAITAQALPASFGPAGAPTTIGGAAPDTAGPLVPDRLPERVTATYADPGTLYLRCGVFGRFTYANQTAARLSGLGADVVRSREGRQTSYAVRAGPFATVAQADAALAQALRAGVIDARITVE